MPFVLPDQLEKTEIFRGVFSGLVTGKNLMLSFLEMAEGEELPAHAHPEEQAGVVLEGRLFLRIGNMEGILEQGNGYIIPPGVVHSVRVEEGPMRVMDVFGPPRKDYLEKMKH